jgi:hypothetical protein
MFEEIYKSICAYGSNTIILSHKFKGTISRDFLTLASFIKQLLLDPLDMHGNDFEFFGIFEKLFVFVIDTPVYSPPESGDSLVYLPPWSRDSPKYSSPVVETSR